MFSQYDFITTNEHNTTKQAYSLLVKWLFDKRYLKLSDDIYSQPLGIDHKELLEFISKHLHNHVWSNQITDTPHLSTFLYNISSNSNIETKAGEKINMYIRYLYIKAAGLWEAHQKLYNSKIEDWYNKVQQFENAISLNEEQAKTFLSSLTQMFALFIEIKNL